MNAKENHGRRTKEIVKQGEVIINIKIKKLQYIGPIMGRYRYGLLKLTILGKIRREKSNNRGRNLRGWFNSISPELFRAAAKKFRIWIMTLNPIFMRVETVRD